VSGLRPGPSCPTRKRERFLAGTEPTDSCDWHRAIGGHVETVYPREVAGWFRAREHRVAEGAGLAILSPTPGAHFLIDPGRPLAHQIPPLEASPFDRASDIRWTIDDAPADTFLPSAGAHRIRAEWQGEQDEVEVVFD
jgi:hypothetical protein